jgi:hypothetical protein
MHNFCIVAIVINSILVPARTAGMPRTTIQTGAKGAASRIGHNPGRFRSSRATPALPGEIETPDSAAVPVTA